MNNRTIPTDDLLLHLARTVGLREAMHGVSAENAKTLLRNFFVSALRSADTSDVVDADSVSHAEFADDWAVAVQAAAARGDFPLLVAGQRRSVETARCTVHDPDLPKVDPNLTTFDDWLSELTENDKREFLSQFWHSSHPRVDTLTGDAVCGRQAAPNEIYLQGYVDSVHDSDVTWCDHPTGEGDTRYLRAPAIGVEPVPCPACKSRDVGGGSGIVHCYKCKLQVERETTALATLAWNERAPLVTPVELTGVAEVLKEGGGFWRTCTGCHESEDGHPVGEYPHSEILKCDLGGGCSECGGIGALWDNLDYEAMGRAFEADLKEEP